MPAAIPADGCAPPEAPASSEVSADPLHTLLDTVATCRPLDQVTTLLAPLKESGRHPDLVREALRTTAVARPVDEVGQLIDLLCKSPQGQAEADILLRAATVKRPMEDVTSAPRGGGREPRRVVGGPSLAAGPAPAGGARATGPRRPALARGPGRSSGSSRAGQSSPPGNRLETAVCRDRIAVRVLTAPAEAYRPGAGVRGAAMVAGE
ncbi:hypothetical protein GCM10010317_062850 [Streptomyces mirabilis]|nr:hypothetical protein GCM10010317_062850 [Streptomyces mirabilis]